MSDIERKDCMYTKQDIKRGHTHKYPQLPLYYSLLWGRLREQIKQFIYEHIITQQVEYQTYWHLPIQSCM